jgi:RNA polymerase sigma-70 factor (ECF subfamily)
LNDLRRAMNMLPKDQCEALTLIGAAGLSYEDAAEICGVAVGTMKSRVSRARSKLLDILDEGDLTDDEISPHAAMGEILRRADQLCRIAA